MPRSSVILSQAPVDAEAIVTATGGVWATLDDPSAEQFDVRALDDGAVLQVQLADTVVLSVLRPRLLPTLDEVARLLPGAHAPDASWWADAYTPWRPEGAIGLAILDAVAAASGAVVVHQGLAPAWRARK